MNDERVKARAREIAEQNKRLPNKVRSEVAIVDEFTNDKYAEGDDVSITLRNGMVVFGHIEVIRENTYGTIISLQNDDFVDDLDIDIDAIHCIEQLTAFTS